MEAGWSQKRNAKPRDVPCTLTAGFNTTVPWAVVADSCNSDLNEEKRRRFLAFHTTPQNTEKMTMNKKKRRG